MTTGAEPQSIVTLLGDPVAGNPTQAMIEAAFMAAGMNWRYVPFRVDSANLRGAVEGLRALGVRGSHVTVPHKVAVVGLLDELTPIARACGAVNCITFVGSAGSTPRAVGDNTDGRGFVIELARHRPIAGASVTVLGAGGAARAIAVELALAGVACLSIVNRNPSRATELVEAIRAVAPEVAVECRPWTMASVVEDPLVLGPDIDVVVNTTSIGLNDPDADVPVGLDSLSSEAIVADVIPNPPMTALLRRAAGRGLVTITGTGMLVEQAVAAAQSWTGVELPTEPMYAAFEAFTTPTT